MYKVLVILIISCLVGCSAVDKRAYTGFEIDRATSRVVTQIDVDNVGGESSPEKAIISAAAIGALANLALNSAVSTVKVSIDDYKDKLVGSFTGAYICTEDKLLERKQFYLTVARGIIGQPKKRDKDGFSAILNMDSTQGQSLGFPEGTGLHQQLTTNFHFADTPSFYLRFKVEIQEFENTSMVIMRPVFLMYPQSIALKEGKDKIKNLVLSLTISGIKTVKKDKIESHEPISVTLIFDFGQLEVGKYYTQNLMHDMEIGQFIDKSVFKYPTLLSINAVDSSNPNLALKIVQSSVSASQSTLESSLAKIIDRWKNPQ